ncbi:unnamed protein product, partial [Polarella glacialis]
AQQLVVVAPPSNREPLHLDAARGPDVHAIQASLSLILPALQQTEATLASLTEDAVADGLGAALRGLGASLSALAATLPVSARQCEQVASTWDETRSAIQTQDITGTAESAITADEVFQVARVVKLLLADVCAALADISRDEVEELAEVGLAVARITVSSALSG